MPKSELPEIFLEKNKTDNIPAIHKLSKSELTDLLERQNRLLKSPVLSHLSDKGEKVKLLKNQIEEELKKRAKADDLCDGLTKLSIHEKKIEVIEWGEKENDSVKKDTPNDEPKDEENPLVLIATHSGTNHSHRINTAEEPDEPLVTLADIEEAYALSLCNKIDKAEAKKKFLPHKSLKSTPDASKHNKVRDLSAATPPPSVFGDVRLLTLEDSIKLQYEQTKHLKEVQLQHATERLKNSLFRMGSDLPQADKLTAYREQVHSGETDEESNSDEEK